MLENIKTWFASRAAGRDVVELEQSYIRLGISSTILVILLFHRFVYAAPGPDDSGAIAITTLYLILSTVLTSLILFGRKESVGRRLAGAWVDIGVVTLFMTFAGDTGIMLIGGYLWVIFGNGFRFGKKYLIHAQLLSIAGFLAAIQINTYWENHEAVIYGMFLMLLALPIYVAALIARIEAAKRKADEASALKTRFVANMSHEIRTPLNGIIGVGTLFRTTPLNEEQQRLIDTLDSSSRLLMSLLNNVLDFAKIEEGKLAIELADFSIDTLMEDTARVFRPQVEAKNVDLEVQITSAIGPLRGDPHRLQQVLANLLGNSVKFTKQGSIILSVAVLRQDEQDCRIRFQVADTGVGIPTEAQGRIFDSFAQADISTTRRYGGSGLGLTIAKHLVEAMGGELAFESVENLGSRFWFDLTLERASRVQPEETATISSTAPKGIEFASSLKILICEDDSTNQNILKRLLELAGHQVTLSDNGEEMLDQLEQNSFDLVIADLNMAGMSGTDALKLYRFTRPDDNRTRFVLFTADATVHARHAAKEAGFDAFLSKPVNASTLFSTIAKLLGMPAATAEHWLSTVMKTHAPASAPAPETRANTAVLLDDLTLRELETLGAGDMFFVDRLLRNYLHDAEELLSRIEQAIAQKHYGSVREYCHALKGNSLSIGAFSVYERAEIMDRADLGELRFRGAAMVKSLRADYEATSAAIDDYMTRRQTASH
jgi:two-component system sensor histidine kinase RpfC